jgi:hypothetical protein
MHACGSASPFSRVRHLGSYICGFTALARACMLPPSSPTISIGVRARVSATLTIDHTPDRHTCHARGFGMDGRGDRFGRRCPLALPDRQAGELRRGEARTSPQGRPPTELLREQSSGELEATTNPAPRTPDAEIRAGMANTALPPCSCLHPWALPSATPPDDCEKLGVSRAIAFRGWREETCAPPEA